MRQWFWNFRPAWRKRKLRKNYLLASFTKHLQILKTVWKAASEFLFRHSMSIFSSVHVKPGFQNNFLNYRWLSEQLFRVPGGYIKAGTIFLKRVAGRIFRISRGLHRSKQKLYFDFFYAKRQPKLWKVSALIKSTNFIFRTCKKIFMSCRAL